MTATAQETRPGGRRRSEFHPLTVAAVEPLTDDAVAVTFDVPAELADEFAFAPGQSLTLRRTIDGAEQRRTYSICAPAGARPRIGVREIPDGLFSSWLVREVRPGDVVEVQPPSGSFRPTRRPAGGTCASRQARASRRCSRSPRRCWSTPRAPTPRTPRWRCSTATGPPRR